jgi:ferrous iron transport protein A
MTKTKENILTELPVGTRAKILKLTAGQSAESQLLGMGVRPGVAIEVVRNDKGPVLVSVANSRIALGRGRASKIVVQVL